MSKAEMGSAAFQGGWSPPTLDVAATESAEALEERLRQLEDSARAEGYKAGFAQGMDEGRSAAGALATQLQSMVSALETPFADSDPQLVRSLLELTEKLAGAVVGRELNADRDALESLVADTLRALGDSGLALEIRLHPQDALLCGEFDCLRGRRVTIREDASLKRGGLQVRAGSQLIDATIETRLHRQMEALYASAGLPSATSSVSTSGESLTVGRPEE
ncbi:MAG: FliH/SctL family protein [Pseudomonadota bacterium]